VAVWVVVGILSFGAVAAIVATRHHSIDAEPTVREFAEFRDALSQQVVDLDTDVQTTRTHLDLHTHPRPVEHDHWG
jgi:hypothetical protein